MDDQVGAEPDEPGEPLTGRRRPHRGGVSYERSPVDVLRTAVGVVLLAALLLADLFFGNTLVSFANDLFSGVDAIPDWIVDGIVIGTRVATTVLTWIGIGAAIWFRRWRVLLVAVAAMLVAGIIFSLVDPTLEEASRGVVDVEEVDGPFDHEDFPTGEGVAIGV